MDGLGNAVPEQRPYMRRPALLARGQVDDKMPLPSNDPTRGRRAGRSATTLYAAGNPVSRGLADAKVRSPRNDPIRGAWLVRSRLPSSVPRRMIGSNPAMTVRGTALPSAADLRGRRGDGDDDAATASGQRQERCVSIGTTPAAPCQAVPRRQAPDQPTPDQPTPDQPATARRRGATGWQSSV